MSPFTETFNTIISALTVLGLCVFVGMVVLYIANDAFGKNISDFLKKRGFYLASLIALFSTLGSLVYSEIIGFAVCPYCWYQRFLMYPLIFIFAYAAFKKDCRVAKVGLAFAVVGGAVALYHYIMQMMEVYGLATMSCAATSTGPSCSALYVYDFGFVTIPFMALVAFLLIIAAAVFGVKKRSGNLTV